MGHHIPPRHTPSHPNPTRTPPHPALFTSLSSPFHAPPLPFPLQPARPCCASQRSGKPRCSLPNLASAAQIGPTNATHLQGLHQPRACRLLRTPPESAALVQPEYVERWPHAPRARVVDREVEQRRGPRCTESEPRRIKSEASEPRQLHQPWCTNSEGFVFGSRIEEINLIGGRRR